MNRYTFHSLFAALVACFVLPLCLFASGTEIIFDNVTSTSKGYHKPSTQNAEMGDEIFFAGTARKITRVEFDYYANIYKNISPAKYVIFRIYHQDGDRIVTEDGTILDSRYPHTVLFESLPLQIFPNYNTFVVDDINVDIPDEHITWTVQAYGLENKEDVRFSVIETPTVGYSYGDFFEKQGEGKSFELKTFELNDTLVNFSIRIYADGAPSRTFKKLPAKDGVIPVEVIAPIYTAVNIDYAETIPNWKSTETVITTNAVTTFNVPETAKFVKPVLHKEMAPELTYTGRVKWRYDFQVFGIPGSFYNLLFSKDMKSWKTVKSGTLHSGTSTVSDTSSYSAKQQGFYILRTVPNPTPTYQFDEPDEGKEEQIIVYFSGVPGSRVKISHTSDGVTWSEPEARTFTYDKLYDSSFGALSYVCPANTVSFHFEY